MRRAVIALLCASALLLAFIAGTASHAPARPAPMPAVAVCAFDGGGMAVAGSVTRTRDGRPWLCTDDGYLVPWRTPAVTCPTEDSCRPTWIAGRWIVLPDHP
jgi:hypothetical protein